MSDLKLGMYVEALDRPWLETGFLLQGLLLRSRADIEQLQATCEYVYISRREEPPQTEKRSIGATVRPLRNRGKPAHRRERERSSREFPEELEKARAIHGETKKLVDTMHDDVRAGREVDTKGAEKAVTQMMGSVARHPDALVWFTNLKKRDEYTARHSMNVCMLAITLSSFIGADEDTIKEMGVGALLHDIGKIKIPLEILNKPGKLTDDEFELIKKHPEFGVEILQDSRDLSPESIEVVYAHHERMDGSGYPRGLVGNQISPYTQMVAIADVYDAMTSDRVYHSGRSPVEVINHMRAANGSFNSEMLEQFVHCVGDYPIGSLVELNTGEVGFVVPRAERNEKPLLILVLDNNKSRYHPQRVRDLVRFPKFSITQVFASGAYGVDVNEYTDIFA